MTLKVISADSHMDLLYLPPEALASRMDPACGGRTRSVTASKPR